MKAALLLGAFGLGLARSALAYNTTLVSLLATEIVEDFEAASTCDSCLSLLVPIQQLANVGDEAFIAVWTTLCTELGLGSAKLCEGDLAEQGPILAHSLRSMNLSYTHTPTMFCLSMQPEVTPHTVVFPVPAEAACSAEYYQCGGINYDGPTCCASGSTCFEQNKYYYQCVAESATTTTTTAKATSTASCAAVYGQCGGSSFSGSTCCQSGSSCVESNTYYSQCVPFAGLASTSSTSAATTTHKVSLAKKRSSSSESTCAQLYYQCGGLNYGDGPTCCKPLVSGSTCVKQNDYYSQCVAEASTATPTATTCSNAAYAQCGGLGFTGTTCCVDGSSCVVSNKYYSQCVPFAGKPTSTSTTATISTPTATSTGISRRTPVQWVHVSDVHIDRYYLPGSSTTCDFGICCRNYGKSSIVNVTSPAGKFGNDNASLKCDAPVDLAKSMIAAVERIAPNRTGSIFTGDIIEGAVWMTNKSEVVGDITAWNDMAFPIYPAVGNHDTSPVNSFPRNTSTDGWASYQWIYDLSSEWAPWIGSSSATTAVGNSGSYSRVHPGTNLKIISINTNLWYVQDFWLYDDDFPTWDPNGLLSWLVDELQAAEDAGQRAWIIGHIPLGKGDMMHDQSNYADQIFQRYNATIAAKFFGHSHKEQFEIGYSDWSNQTAETALGISFVAGALTPTSGNPVFRVYDVDPDSFEVMDHKSYIANYSAPSFQVEPEWFLYYSAREAYGPLVGLQDGEALDAKFWHKLTQVFESNSTAFEEWNERQSRGGMVTSCVDDCITTTICDMRASRSENNCDVRSAGIAFNRKRSLTSDEDVTEERIIRKRTTSDCDHTGTSQLFSGAAEHIATANKTEMARIKALFTQMS